MPKKSSTAIDSALEKTLRTSFFQVIADLSNEKEVEIFFQNLFSEAELSMFYKRLAIATMLDNGHHYEDIKQTLKVSSATISTVAEHLNTRGFRLALQKIRTEHWAAQWSSKVMQMFGADRTK